MAETTPFLRNRYWVLRHGRSIPNERGIVVSSMENGTRPEYQLAPEGASQAQSAGQSFQKAKGDGQPLRTRLWSFYHDIWAPDEKDPLMRPAEGGESIDDVACRLAEAMEIMEPQYQGCTILVFSHGDTLQILLTILNAAKLNAGSSHTDLSSRIQAVRNPPILSQHRKFSLLTAELRAVIQVSSLKKLSSIVCSLSKTKIMDSVSCN